MGDAPGFASRDQPARGAVGLYVVLSAPGSTEPEALLRGLRQRGVRVQVVPDAPSVMVELAGGAEAVIVNEARQVRRLAELLGAMRRYYPRAVCWQFTSAGGSGQPSLEKIDAHAPGPAAQETAAPRNNGGHAPARRGSDRLADPGLSPVLSPEEMAMLLAPLPQPDTLRGADGAGEKEGEA